MPGPFASFARQMFLGLRLTGVLILLAGCSRPDPFVLEFPPDRSIGKLAITEDVNCFTCGNGHQDLGEARGKHKIRLPDSHWFVSLTMPRKASHLLPSLSHPSLTKLGLIDLSNSDVADADLAHLSSIPLRHIHLKNTAITGAGLKYLKADPNWVFVALNGCQQLDPKYLSHFNGWRRATITLPYKPNDPNRALANRLICDGQSEDICKTQIRWED